MQKFTFKYKDKVVEVEHEQKLAAMEIANRQLPLGDGAWFSKGVNTYKWEEGNFFD